jgi:hypothetical protein
VSEPGSGRPVVDAEPATPVGSERPTRAEEARRSAYRSRFAAVYLALAVVAGGAIGAFIVLLARPEPPAPPAWSAWQPTGSAEARVRQIADQVSTQYRLPSGNQLAVATVESPPRVSVSADQPDLPIKRIVIRPDTSKGREEESDIKSFDTADTVVFKLCGLSQDCSIPEGAASPERYQLLRREALELALYTFRYLDDVRHVAVFLPPPPVTNVTEERQPQTSVFLRRQDVSAQLRQPLPYTLANRAPEVGQISPTELPRIQGLLGDRTYTFEYSYQPADNSVLAVLSPV